MWNAGLLPWRPELADAAAALNRELTGVAPDSFADAVTRQAHGQLAAFLDGVAGYRAHPYRRKQAEPDSVWQDGTTRLLHFPAKSRGKRAAVSVLAVPSLINRAYILDLGPRLSLLRWLAGQGAESFLVDWDAPGAAERGFDLTDYIAGRLEAALDQALARARGPLVVLGYCMGGLLAVALALRRRQDLAGLVLLATPWDFHADQPERVRALVSSVAPTLDMLDGLGALPVDALQTMFYGLDPFLVVRKFERFATLDPKSSRAAHFVALEDWLNDGVPLAMPVARECILGWYGDNTPQRGTWTVAGVPVDPRALDLPSLAVIPAQDRIVPPASAQALAAALPGCDTFTPRLGHIGMVVGSHARTQVWPPLAAWLGEHVARGR
jgi:polyhydroxyalkanoate synthase